MAITLKLDPAQVDRIVGAVNKGFADLISALGGDEDQLQTIIDQLATNLNLSTDEVEAAIKQAQQTKG